MPMFKQINLTVSMPQDLWPYEVINVIQRVMEEGLIRHPHGDGFKEDVYYHIDRAQNHLAGIESGNDTDEPLDHAFTRLMMAIAIRERIKREEAEKNEK